MGFLRDRFHRAAEVDVDHADAELVGQLGPDGGQRFGIVVPDLHGQRTRLLFHAPQPVGKVVLLLLHPQKALGVDHFGGLQADAAEIADDLPEGIVGESGHRRLQHRRIDHQRPDRKGSDPRGQIEIGSGRRIRWLPCTPSRGDEKVYFRGVDRRRRHKPSRERDGLAASLPAAAEAVTADKPTSWIAAARPARR